MKPALVNRRAAGTAVATLMLAAGTVGALASPAAAKANSMTVGKVALDTRHAVITAALAYSCDPGSDVHVATTATRLHPAKGHRPAVATATLTNKKLVCDARQHRVRLTLHPKPGSAFHKGNKVQVVASIVTPHGAHYADAKKIVTL
ncbi:hypothetical protein [Streptomyces albospinus]|uniref:hypothetical protein n=1 Tax=Streptomyces albospinus TaxID=285515 RepID=UPI001671813B|nr:hypothetical protein [Streptomyces albospinus]